MNLVMGVDFVGPPVQFDNEIPRNSWPIKLNDGLLKEVLQWNDDFIAAIIDESSPDNATRVKELNAVGYKLSQKIEQSLGGEWKVRYRSESPSEK